MDIKFLFATRRKPRLRQVPPLFLPFLRAIYVRTAQDAKYTFVYFPLSFSTSLRTVALRESSGLYYVHPFYNHPHNHRKYNIALVAEGLNSQKCDKILHIKEPYFFTAVMSDGKYKIVVGSADEDLILDSTLFITKHFENVVGLLTEYRKLYPHVFNKAEAAANNKGLFYERFFCEAIADTADEHFIDLDKIITPTEAVEGV